MKILTTEQIRQADQYTIQNEPISSVDLMERAASQLFDWLSAHITDKECDINIFCGMGNNGGDGLVLARLLKQALFRTKVYMVRYSDTMSPDCEANYHRLTTETDVPVSDIKAEADFPTLEVNSIVIDALFGSGLNRPIEGMVATLIDHLNSQPVFRIAIDIPSGLFADSPSPKAAIFRANCTLTFQTPKLAFLMPENGQFVGHVEILDIQLHPRFLNEAMTNNLLIEQHTIQSLLHERPKFSHKGTYGHALLIAGSKGMTGAAILGAKSCLRTGVGLLTVLAPQAAQLPLQASVPEAMVYTLSGYKGVEHNINVFSDFDSLDAYNAIGVGPGLGRAEDTERTLKRLIQECKVPLVMDADALNILAENPTWLPYLPPKTILTPHPKEFERLFGKTTTSFERLELQREMAKKHNIIIVLKGAYTATAFPNGAVFFNSTGNPGMATAGSGDVLTGMILSLLAQRYSPEEAAAIGVYLHGLAGDLAAKELSQEAMIASDITEHIGKAFLSLKE